ncbi:hypothetical protein [Nitrospirillum sp. BR 11828]|uniref:hypothetical protein n=1 Tax=Nitrospirillum sp. BR 11828 TaxID=3104325 RepID=UPI002ACACADA|nr:hypothetical protein [Nitrospirillum sp. BR 11828]MDZ5645690.1 hypothetical protein [Nitrospirillum sp. BR 11828]
MSHGEPAAVLPKQGVIVTELAGARAVAMAMTPADQGALAPLGFQLWNGEHRRAITSTEDRITLIHALIDIGALFSSGRDWCPAEVVAHYRDNGRVDRPYWVIAWTEPKAFSIRPA